MAYGEVTRLCVCLYVCGDGLDAIGEEGGEEDVCECVAAGACLPERVHRLRLQLI